MENFGLGILLSFQDNASSGIERVQGALGALKRHIEEMNSSASDSVGRLDSMASALGVIGGLATGVGMAITGAFGGVIKKTMDMSSGFEQNITALTQLYGSADIAKQKFLDFEKMSAATPLGMQQIQSAATRMKTVGIDAEKMFSVMVDGEKKMRPVLEILGDLAAIRPDKGLDAVIREGIEFVEGNARPIRMSFGLNVKEKLGEGLADSAEGRLEQLVRMIEKSGYTGMLDKTNDQWATIMQNLGDNFDLLMYYVGIGSGLFEDIKKPFKELFTILRDIVGEQKDMEIIGGAIADGLRIVIAPVITVLHWLNQLVKVVAQFTKDHPKIVSMGIAIAGLGGQLLALFGITTLVTATWIKLNIAWNSANSALGFVRQGLTLLRANFVSLLGSMLPIVVTAGLLYYAWSRNLFGIRSFVTGGLQYLANVISIVVEAFSNLDSENKRFRLSMRNAKLAEEMGILDFVIGLMTAIDYVITFFNGIKNGIDVAVKEVTLLTAKFDSFLNIFKNTPLEGFAESIREMFSFKLDDSLSSQISFIGYQIGRWGGYILSAVAGMKLASFAVSSVVGILMRFTGSSPSVLSLSDAFTILSDRIQTVYYRLVALNARGTAAFIRFFRLLPYNFSILYSRITRYFYNIADFAGRASDFMLNRFLRILDPIVNGISRISGAISGLYTRIMSGNFNYTNILSGLGRVYNFVVGIIGRILQRIVAFRRLLQMQGVVRVVLGAFRSLFSGILRGLVQLVIGLGPVGVALIAIGALVLLAIKYWDEFKEAAAGVWAHITNTINGAIERLTPVWERLKAAFSQLGERIPILGQVFDWIGDKISAVWDFITGKSESGSEIASAIFNALGVAINVAFDFIVAAIELAINTIASIIEGFIKILTGVIDFVTGVFTGDWGRAWEGVKSVFEGVFGTITNIINGFKDTVGGLIDSIMGKTAEAGSKVVELENGTKAHVAYGRFGKGGIVTAPTLAYIAEEGYPEVVVPLKKDDNSRQLLGYAMAALGVNNDMGDASVDVIKQVQNVGANINLSAPNIPRINMDSSPIVGGFEVIANVMGDFVSAIEVLPDRFYNAVFSAVNGIPLPATGNDMAPVVSVAPVQNTISYDDTVSAVRRPVYAPQEQVASAQSMTDGGVHLHFDNGAIQFNVNGEGFNADEAARQLMPRLKRMAEVEFMQKRGR